MAQLRAPEMLTRWLAPFAVGGTRPTWTNAPILLAGATRALPFAAHQHNTSFFNSTLADGTFFVEGLSAFARIRASDLAVLRVWTGAEWGLEESSANGGA